MMKSSFKLYLITPMALGAFSASLDNNILNICIPIISKEFNSSIALAQFISSSYTFTICSLLLFFSYISSYLGRVRVFSIGTGVFCIASFMSIFSLNIYILIFLRIVQGLGAAMFMANGMVLISSNFSNEHKGKAFGIISTSTSLASITGPVIGGAIASNFGWRYVFLFMVPFAAFASISSMLILKNEPEKKPDVFDTKGSLLSFTVVLLFFNSLLFLSSYKIVIFTVLIILAFILMLKLMKLERTVVRPVLDIKIFKFNNFIRYNLQSLAVFSIMMSVGLLIPIFVQDILKISVKMAGLALSEMALSIFIVSLFSGKAVDDWGTTIITKLGLFIILFGNLLIIISFIKIDLYCLSAGIILLGAGIGLFNPANNKAVMTSVPIEYAGTAASINVLFRNVGIAGGTALTGIIYSFLSTFALYNNIGLRISLMIFVPVLIFFLVIGNRQVSG